MIFSRAFTCSSVVRLSSCRAQICCPIVDMDGFTLGKYYGIDLGSQEGSTEGTKCGNI